MAEEDQDPSFKVSDRRRFSSEGELLDETQEAQTEAAASPEAAPAQDPEVPEPAPPQAEAPQPETSQPEASQPEAPQAEAAPADTPASPPASEAKASESASPPLPPATFELLIISLAIQAQMQLAEEGTPKGRTPDLDVARHSIDLLDVLKTKTQGNLTLEESRLLDNTLTELRFLYIQRVEEINKAAKA